MKAEEVMEEVKAEDGSSSDNDEGEEGDAADSKLTLKDLEALMDEVPEGIILQLCDDCCDVCLPF